MNLIGGFELGLLFSILAFGVFISFKILNIPDLTIDASFVSGMAVAVGFALEGKIFLGLLMAILVGMIAGLITGLLQTVFKVSSVLSGILTMTAFYSINLHLMGGRPNIALIGVDTLFTDRNELLILGLIVLGLLVFMIWLFHTHFGLCLIATGDNEEMIRASSINLTLTKVWGLAISNGLVALSGGIFGHYQAFSDITSGTGMMVIGLASVILGETFFRTENMSLRLILVIVGSVIYRLILTFAMERGLPASDLKLLSAVLVGIVITIPTIRAGIKEYGRRKNA